jgi:hypothetical protein
MNDSKDDDILLNFQDLVAIKNFLEKGFREKFFTYQELPGATHTHTKLTKIIKHILKENQD